MGIQTIATELLGIEHPIVCGGMTATGSAELAAAGSRVVSACVCVLGFPPLVDGMVLFLGIRMHVQDTRTAPCVYAFDRLKRNLPLAPPNHPTIGKYRMQVALEC